MNPDEQVLSEKNERDCSVACRWLPRIAYGVSLGITIVVGIQPMLYFLSIVFALFASFGFIWSVLVWNNSNAASRFLISASVPLLFPWLLRRLIDWL